MGYFLIFAPAQIPQPNAQWNTIPVLSMVKNANGSPYQPGKVSAKIRKRQHKVMDSPMGNKRRTSDFTGKQRNHWMGKTKIKHTPITSHVELILPSQISNINVRTPIVLQWLSCVGFRYSVKKESQPRYSCIFQRVLYNLKRREGVNMDFKDLIYLDAIDRHRSLTYAVEELYISAGFDKILKKSWEKSWDRTVSLDRSSYGTYRSRKTLFRFCKICIVTKGWAGWKNPIYCGCAKINAGRDLFQY